MADDRGVGKGEKKETSSTVIGNGKKRKGFFSRIWNGISRLHGDDLEKRLQYISKEEAAALARLSRRSRSWRRTSRHLIIFSVIFEVIAVGYAIMTTRSMDLNWKMKAIRILPMFLLPALSSAVYSTFISFTRMCECQKFTIKLYIMQLVYFVKKTEVPDIYFSCSIVIEVMYVVKSAVDIQVNRTTSFVAEIILKSDLIYNSCS